ncbi:PAS domain S-box-containing protein [Bacillus ectoiniformans]|uniref:ATP-binding protein n=1 Tax=Bacillus ectoiniformans TaxID=1494429 RepID=UPI00195BF1EB|nr:ATP-binding protein [Bacillus ectoiniformans]MBM7648726.1 PAS domain S-box-containing protein [Bacillus ectoiniformans]
MDNIGNNSIRTNYIRYILILLLIVTAVFTAFFMYSQALNDSLKRERDSLREKAKLVEEMDKSFNQIFFRARGYYAFQDEKELSLLYDNLEKFEKNLNQFKKLDLSSEEKELYNSLIEFHENYKNNILPIAVGLVKNDDYEGLRSLSSGGTNELVNNFVKFSSSFKNETDARLNELFHKILDQGQKTTILAFVGSGLTVLIFIIAIWLLLLNLIRPLEKMIAATNALSLGNFINLDDINQRKDELGLLSNAFIDMSKSIQEKEGELTAQNEELTAQQLELEENQERLQHSLTEVHSMTKALDKSAVVAITDKDGVLTYVNDMFCELTKYSQDEVIGKTQQLIKSSYHPDSFFENMWKTIQNGVIWGDEVQYKAKDGELFWLKNTIVPYVDAKGIPYQYIMIGINITKIKEMQKKLAASLEQSEETKLHLEQYDKLNHSLTFTLDKHEFITVIHQYLFELHKFDSSIMFVPGTNLYVSQGLAPNSIEKIFSSFSEDKLTRLQSDKSFVIKREMANGNCLTEDVYYCYDLYSAIRNKEGEIVAILAATREGHSFQLSELNEINGMMNRVSIAFERILMHEDVEKARKLNQDIMDNVNEGIQFISDDGKLIQVNEAFCNMVQCNDWSVSNMGSKKEWISYLLEKCNDTSELKDFLHRSIEEEFRETRKCRYSLGKDLNNFIEVYATSVFAGEDKIGTVLVHRDITKEHEVDQMKSELVSTVSHELRTPLSSVLGFTELLLNKQVKPERQKKYIETIHKEAKRLTNLINDFLDLQRMETGKQQYYFKPTNMDKLAIDVVNRFRHEKNHSIQLIDGARYVEVSADYERIVQVLINLIGNAIKFSPNGGEVVVSLENNGDDIQVKIQDQGLGIPENELSKLFQKFKRIDNSSSRKIGGTGLGLAISKEIISKHSGEIWIESAEGKGTSVYFSLPLLTKPMKNNKHMSINKGLNVMIVEDDASLALLLSEELKGKGYTVIHHTHPQQAFEDATRLNVVGLIIDIMLGEDINGWDLVEKLKENEHTKHIPIIISSALDRSDEKVQQYNIEKYLTKPYPPEQLSRVLANFINQESDQGTVHFPDVHYEEKNSE